ncbi:ABC transporter ATP-binding protein [Clostridium sp. 'deep sea']|uniref:ABC transporter ATP-binding protein n=1 Tax=Clostridium sp. 'deep sea' TaxID=2779445 RepID=UPI001FAB94FB|nr:ABC transporter ATP-binding protein [Clostridium sp. 'deep sea']
MNKVIELKGIVKKFGPVYANDHVDFDLFKGEVHAILGENGAGKSSLMNVIAGVYQPDEGEIVMNGERVTIPSPRHSIDMGIGMIHQHFKLVESHTVLENMVAGLKSSFFINRKKLGQHIQEISQKYGLEISPFTEVSLLSVAEKQRVEILKVLYRGAKVLILDEPTAVLTPQESNKLFKIINSLKADGHSIIFISHKLDEVIEICDRITVLRKGKYICTLNNENLSPRELTNQMVGKAVELQIDRPKVKGKNTILEVKDLTVYRKNKSKALKNLFFKLKQGEILGVAGVAGSGQKELCEAIAGLQPHLEGEIKFKSEDICGKSPREIINLGISMSFVPEDRLGMGLVAGMDIVDNVLLKSYLNQPGLFVNRNEAKTEALRLIKKLNIDTPSATTKVSKLSGGNIQKVLLGREIELQPELIITAYPARGLDIGSAHKIYDLLNEQKIRGNGIIFIGEDLDVLLQLADKIMVLCDGEVTGIVNPQEVTREDLGYMMAGKRLERGNVS